MHRLRFRYTNMNSPSDLEIYNCKLPTVHGFIYHRDRLWGPIAHYGYFVICPLGLVVAVSSGAWGVGLLICGMLLVTGHWYIQLRDVAKRSISGRKKSVVGTVSASIQEEPVSYGYGHYKTYWLKIGEVSLPVDRKLWFKITVGQTGRAIYIDPVEKRVCGYRLHPMLVSLRIEVGRKLR